MEALATILIIIIVLFYFKGVIGKSASVLENTINVVADTTDDSLKTYGNEVRILNAEKRSEQVTRLNKLDHIVSNEDIEALLAATLDAGKEESKV